MTKDRLFDDPDLAQFYDLENGWGPDFDYCVKLSEHARSVLDLGCGTGELAAALARGRSVVGVDPAAAMLDVARRRDGGDQVTWIEADARDVRLGRTFDLVLLTGHAFQVFLTEEDQRAVLETIRAHLAPDGRFIFDTRNRPQEEWRSWTPEQSRRRFEHPTLGAIEAWNAASHDTATGVVTYETHYRILRTGQTLSAESKISFTPKNSLARLLEGTGLQVDEWLGDWNGTPWQPDAPEIIPVGRKR